MGRLALPALRSSLALECPLDSEPAEEMLSLATEEMLLLLVAEEDPAYRQLSLVAGRRGGFLVRAIPGNMIGLPTGVANSLERAVPATVSMVTAPMTGAWKARRR